MRATGINHVSVSAVDLEKSMRFYEQLFGAERLPTPNFGMPVQWLRIANQQLHVFVRDTDAPRYHHVAFDVDDLEAVYTSAKELEPLDSETNGAEIREHPSGCVQMYLRDPAGNLVEVDWPDASTLDRAVVKGVIELGTLYPQEGEAASATLYPAGAAAYPW